MNRERRSMEHLLVELLEHVLSQLPPRDLLLSQSVCRRWRSVVVSSPSLQQALFLTPAPGPFPGWKRTYTASNTNQFTFEPIQIEKVTEGLFQFKNPANLRSRLDNLERDEVAWRFAGEDLDPEIGYAEKEYVHGPLNPLFWQSWDENLFSQWNATTAPKFVLCGPGRNAVDYGSWERFRSKLLDSDVTASWRNMSISQPPVKRIWVENVRNGEEDDPSSIEKFCFTAKGGKMITMGDFVEVLTGVDEDGDLDTLTGVYDEDEERQGEYGYVFRLEGVVCPLPLSEEFLREAMSR